MQRDNILELTAVVRKEGKFYVALCPEFDAASQGKSVEEALKNLREAVELFLEDKDVEKPAKSETPIVTIIKVDVADSARKEKS
jgi:predicted RNase H-like HicB family nuclease